MNVKNSRETILNQALTIFGRLGFHKTTMADIADASKRGRRTIYTYFKNKEEVYEAVIEREIDRIIEIFYAELKNSQSPEEKLSKYINTRILTLINLATSYDALRIAYLNNYKWVEKIRAKLDMEEKNILTDIFKSGLNNNAFTIEDIDTSVKSIALVIKGVEFLLLKEDNHTTTKIQLANLQTILLDGLKSRNSK